MMENSDNLSQALSQDPLLAIFGSGRLTGSDRSHCSQDGSLLLGQSDIAKDQEANLEEPASSLAVTTKETTDKSMAVNQLAMAVNQSATALNQSTMAVNLSTMAVNQSATAVNQSAAAVNQSAMAVNQSATAVNQSATTVNQSTMAVNQSTTAVNQSAISMQFAADQSACGDVTSCNGSVDLFNSQSDQGSLLDNKNLDITLQLTEFVWVQCDNPDCQKWRRIPASDADDLGDDQWYCYMSTDPERNACSAAEEDHAMYDRMARKVGIKYVMSMLSVGSLVWAKLAGYCRWPALVTRDPQIGCHVLVDIDGDASSYHVEFLGKAHSHSWVTAKCVEVYGHKAWSQLEDSQSQPGKHGKGSSRGRQKKTALTVQSGGKRKSSYKRMHINGVIREADFLLSLETEERLKYSVFKYDPVKLQIKEERDGKRESEKCSQCKSKGRKQKKILSGKDKLNDSSTVKAVLDSLKQTDNVEPEKNNSHDGGRKKLKTGKENYTVFDYTSDSVSNCEISLDEGISVKTVKTEVSVFDSPDQFSQSHLKFMNPMQDKSKEEKFSIDIDMYRKNEAAFEHDVRRFMTRNDLIIRSTPMWHTVPVRLFQLYLAVHERGGFDEVNRKKQWTGVYKELTEQQHVSSGVAAKKYYLKNLYPYELYITGQDYESIVRERRKPNTKVREKRKCQTPVPAEVNKKLDATPILFKDDGATLSQEIEAILDKLEEDCSPQHKAQKADIKFHDDNTVSSQAARSVPSEFGPSSASDLQEVPSVGYSGDGLSDIQEKILHEMKALEDDMKEIGEFD